MKKVYLTEKQINEVMDSLPPTNANGETPIHRFSGMSDDEFNELYENPEEAELMNKLMDLTGEGVRVLSDMRWEIENSPYYEGNEEKLKKYLDRIDKITDTINELLY